MKVAQAGWRAECHSLSATDFQAEIDGYGLVNDSSRSPTCVGRRPRAAHDPQLHQQAQGARRRTEGRMGPDADGHRK